MIINIDKTLVILMMISYFLPDPFKNILFWLPLIVLSIRSYDFFRDSKEKRTTLFLLKSFVILFIIQLLANNKGAGWAIRLFGLTRCIIGFELFIISGKRSFENIDFFRILCVFLTVYNIFYIYSFSTGHNEYFSNYGSINSCCALNAIFIPYFICRKKNISLLTILYAISFLILIVVSSSETFYVCLAVDLLIYLYIMAKKNINIRLKSVWKIGGISLFIIIAIFLINFFINKKFSGYILLLLGKFDMARSVIYEISVNSYLNLDTFEKIFGSGNNIIYRTYDSTAAHNMFLETALIYGLLGLVLAILEMIFLINTIKQLKNDEILQFIFLPMAGGYIMFMFHPFYTTFYIEKLLLTMVIYQMRYFSFREKLTQ